MTRLPPTGAWRYRDTLKGEQRETSPPLPTMRSGDSRESDADGYSDGRRGFFRLSRMRSRAVHPVGQGINPTYRGGPRDEDATGDMTIEKIKGGCPLCNGSGLVATDYGSLRGCDCRFPKPRKFTPEQIREALQVAGLLSQLAREGEGLT